MKQQSVLIVDDEPDIRELLVITLSRMGLETRVAANLVAKEDPYRRGCHGELFTVPHSAMARWAETADQVVVIDGCFLRCHGRVLRGLINGDRLVEFDALSRYKKYTDIFDIDGVPEAERNEAAQEVAGWVLESMSGSARQTVLPD